MAEAARSVSARANRGLPDEIVIWEILVRLPPKSLLRCRAVCHAWRRITSTRDFLLAHHTHQPALPVAFSRDDGRSRSIITFDNRAADAQLQRVTRLENRVSGLYYSCDGLILLLCSRDTSGTYLCICNPATRQSARVPMVSGYVILGMYRHHPTGEYRLLMYRENQEINGNDACYIFTLGSVQPPRNIGWQPEAKEVYCNGGQPVLLGGSLHCPSKQREIGSNNIVVFDTSTELFRHMPAPVAPVAPRYNELFEMDGVLGMYICNDDETIIDIWVLMDYENEVWTFKCKIALPVTEIKVMCGKHEGSRHEMFVVPGNGELLVLVKFAEWLLQVDMEGKLVATFHRKEVFPTQLQLKQTLVPHAFFPTRDGNLVNAPFLI